MTIDGPQGPTWETIPETETEEETPSPETEEESPEADTPDDSDSDTEDDAEDTEDPSSPPDKENLVFGRYKSLEDAEKAHRELQRKLGEQGNELGQLRKQGAAESPDEQFVPHQLGKDGNYRDELGVVYYTPAQWRQFTHERLVPEFTDEEGNVDHAGLMVALLEAKEKDKERYDRERQSIVGTREAEFSSQAEQMRSGFAPRIERAIGSEASAELFRRVDDEMKKQPVEVRTNPQLYKVATAAALGLMILEDQAPGTVEGVLDKPATAPTGTPSRPRVAPVTRPNGGGAARPKRGQVPEEYRAAVERGDMTADEAIKYGRSDFVLET